MLNPKKLLSKVAITAINALTPGTTIGIPNDLTPVTSQIPADLAAVLSRPAEETTSSTAEAGASASHKTK